MAKTRKQKEQIVKDLTERLKKVKSLVFANFDNLTVKETEELRDLCEKENVDYLVTKKTLLKLALKNTEIKGVDPKQFDRGVATVFAYEDEVAPARILANFAKEHEALKMTGGVLEGKFIDLAKLEELAKLPSKQELLTKLVGTINAPVSGLVNVLQGNLGQLVFVIQAIKDNKQ